MLLYFHVQVSRLRLTPEQLIDCAYYWKHQKAVDLRADHVAYRLRGQLPSYVIDFLNYIKETECKSSPAPSAAVTSPSPTDTK